MSAQGWKIVMVLSGIWFTPLVHPIHLAAQQTPHASPRVVGLPLPSKLHGYVLQDSSPLPPHGMTYRYMGDSANTLIVLISRLWADTSHTASVETAHHFLKSQAAKYADSLPLGVTQGTYDAYDIAYSEVVDTTIGRRIIPGYLFAAAVRRQQTINVKFLYLYAIQDLLVQVRTTIPQAQIGISALPLFVHDLVGQVVHQVLVSQSQPRT